MDSNSSCSRQSTLGRLCRPFLGAPGHLPRQFYYVPPITTAQGRNLVGRMRKWQAHLSGVARWFPANKLQHACTIVRPDRSMLWTVASIATTSPLDRAVASRVILFLTAMFAILTMSSLKSTQTIGLTHRTSQRQHRTSQDEGAHDNCTSSLSGRHLSRYLPL